MTREDIIAMAQEAGCSPFEFGATIAHVEDLERFAALVASAERNRTWTQAHWTEYEHAIVAQEREACAKVADGYISADPIAAAIRARGQA